MRPILWLAFFDEDATIRRSKRCMESNLKHLKPMDKPALASTPEPPYYAVIFTSQRAEGDFGYDHMAKKMVKLASQQPGFLGVESARSENGLGITISYWANEEAIVAWKAHLEHKPAQEAGKRVWYADYEVRIAKVERAYGKL